VCEYCCLLPVKSPFTNARDSCFICRLNKLCNQTSNSIKRSWWSDIYQRILGLWSLKINVHVLEDKCFLICTSWGRIHCSWNNQVARFYYAYWWYVADIGVPFVNDELTIGLLFGRKISVYQFALQHARDTIMDYFYLRVEFWFWFSNVRCKSWFLDFEYLDVTLSFSDHWYTC
jgi:hypothetical protein